MESGASDSHDSASHDEREVRSLYRELLNCWNRRDASGFASHFAEDSNVVGFDGSQINGRAEIESVLGKIFTDHPTAAYVSIVRSVRFLTPDVVVVSAVVGMVPPGQSDLNPAVNAVQTLVAAKHDGRWRIAVFQNTPAAFHGRPELVEKLTEDHVPGTGAAPTPADVAEPRRYRLFRCHEPRLALLPPAQDPTSPGLYDRFAGRTPVSQTVSGYRMLTGSGTDRVFF